MGRAYTSDEMIGKIFGKWTVIQKGEEARKWLCKCECGTIKEVNGYTLRNGSSTNCGCSRNYRNNDLSNQKFGKLTALEPTNKRIDGRIVWKCLCECGEYCEATSSALTQGKKISCGCSQYTFKDLTNQRFGRLIALEPTKERKNKNIVWKCQCDCGNIHYVTENALVENKSHSCGCLKTSLGEEKIKQILQNNNISYKTEYIFQDFNKYRFDFYIENKKYLIEFDGKQHFEYNSQGWNTKETYEKTVIRDNLKNNYCKENNIPLIRIPYTRYEELCLEDLLLETTKYRVV